MCTVNVRVNTICKQDWFKYKYIEENGVATMLESMHKAVKYRYSKELDLEIASWLRNMVAQFDSTNLNKNKKTTVYK